MSYEDDTIRPDARLIILKELAKQVDERLNSVMLTTRLRDLAIDRPRHWVHAEMEWLAEVGAVTLEKADTVMVATLTEKGARHLRRAIAIEGVARPSRPGA